MTHVLFERGWPEKGSMRAVYAANLESSIRFISRENAQL